MGDVGGKREGKGLALASLLPLSSRALVSTCWARFDLLSPWIRRLPLTLILRFNRVIF